MAEKLDINSAFPALTLNLVDGGTRELPRELRAKYNVVLIYRGHW